MDEWYGDGLRRQALVARANTMYRAGAGDTTVLPDLAALAVDRANGTLIRASAAEFAGQLIAKAAAAKDAGKEAGKEAVSQGVVNALIGASNDSEAWVRIEAVRALGLLGDQPRATSAIAAHLTDPSRVARVSAAEALLNLGITSLESSAGQHALASAQDEWAESLRTFGDVASDHTTLGWLLAARGDSEQATKELRLGAALDPSDARPHVYLGVLAARAERFDEALQQFKTAKMLYSSYRNLDRLIEEAEKRTIKRD